MFHDASRLRRQHSELSDDASSSTNSEALFKSSTNQEPVLKSSTNHEPLLMLPRPEKTAGVTAQAFNGANLGLFAVSHLSTLPSFLPSSFMYYALARAKAATLPNQGRA